MIRPSLSAAAPTALGLAAALGLAGCSAQSNQSQAAAVANPCGAGAAALSSTLPQNVGADAVAVDCFAWASFVALNWRADPARPGYPDPKAGPAAFGVPGSSTSVWQTYLEAAAVFGGAALKGAWQARRPAVLVLTRTSKTGALDLSDITQAGGGHHWLTSQRGDITYYQVMMNRDEYEFITTQKFDLTTAAGQRACAMQPGKVISDGPPVKPPPTGPLRGGLVMPEGNQPGWKDTDCEGNPKAYGDGVGAMEIKASWTPLPADGSLDYRYKTAVAEIVDPVTRARRTVTVGLVGLHIARKRFPSHQWTWSTFEHVDNSPDEAPNNGWSAPVLPDNPNRKPSPGFTFFNPNCNPATNAFKCVHNAPPTRCLLGTNPATCQRYNVPMQITRLNPVDSAANSVTAWYWSLLPAGSVFNYYRLVNVQWPQTPGSPQAPGQRVPLGQGNPMPVGGSGGASTIVANTTMESFVQASASCMDCHTYASIATPALLQARPDGLRAVKKNAAAPAYASDYSFIFSSETRR